MTPTPIRTNQNAAEPPSAVNLGIPREFVWAACSKKPTRSMFPPNACIKRYLSADLDERLVCLAYIRYAALNAATSQNTIMVIMSPAKVAAMMLPP